MQEEAIFWSGFGLDASYSKIEEKGVQYHLFLGDKLQYTAADKTTFGVDEQRFRRILSTFN